MKALSLFSVFAVLSAPAFADLQPFTDYEASKAVYHLTTIQVDPNMHDAYLEGIERTWVSSNEIAKKLGHIVDYSIYRSTLPESGDFNLMLVIVYASAADMEPNKEKYEAFIEAWGKENADAVTDFSQKNYPAMRTIDGEYLLRKITLK
ncbi:MAG: hypothetical protein CMO98_02235 [Woeseia sp.]|nr:hypothetical protein [Woeseia sp.]|tara:strand:+ start:22 stop:468 length:447 start_codon:yes stop_codon:yes gene_type:complete